MGALMKSRSTAILLAEKCKNILASNWHAQLHTIEGTVDGSKELYRSKVNYIMMKGKPYLWIPEDDKHNLNIMFDERGSLSVASPYPGTLGKLLKSINKFPERVAFTGELVHVTDKKCEEVRKYVKEIIETERRDVEESTHAVKSLLGGSTALRSDSLKCLKGGEEYSIYNFNIRNCMFVDLNGIGNVVDAKEVRALEADPLGFMSSRVIDGINRSETRRRALMMFCLMYTKANVRDAIAMWVDRKGIDVLGKLPCGNNGFEWKEFRFLFDDEASDLQSFCERLILMEDDVLSKLLVRTGLPPCG